MAFHDEAPLAEIPALYGPLLAKLEAQRTILHARVQQLDETVREADAWSRRRAAAHARDRACYRLGAAFEPGGGLVVDDVFVSGLDLLGGHGVALLAAASLIAPAGTSLSEIMAQVARTKAGKVVRDWGVWSRFTWLRELYQSVVLAFEESRAGRNRGASWRKDTATARQAYLIIELARFLQVEPPELTSRGDAHDWLLRQGGNPRFLVPAEQPPLPSLRDLDW